MGGRSILVVISSCLTAFKTCAIALKFQISMWMSGVSIIRMYLEFVGEKAHECWQTSQ